MNRALTVEEVADRLGAKPQHVRYLLGSGELVGWRMGSGKRSPWRVDPEDLEAFKEKRKAAACGSSGVKKVACGKPISAKVGGAKKSRSGQLTAELRRRGLLDSSARSAKSR